MTFSQPSYNASLNNNNKDGVDMFRYFIFSLYCMSFSHATSSLPARIDDMTAPQVVAARPGVYTFTLSTDIAMRTLDALRSLPKDSAKNYTNAPAEDFEELLRSFIYPHPSTVNGTKCLWKGFLATISNIRETLGEGEALPFFSLSKYEKSGTLDEAVDLFRRHIESALAALPTPTDPELVGDILSQELPRTMTPAQELLTQYNTFYASRGSPFRKHDIEHYVRNLLQAVSNPDLSEKSLTILDILQRTGCLTLASPIRESRGMYSPKAMVETYIAHNGIPTTIVLGCGHANSRDLLETLGLKAETWCGDCDKLPHANAMVVSLDESSADVMGDLNHPDLWTPLPNRSITTIRDETWCLSCYTTATLDQIARVLKIGGEFDSSSHAEGLTIKSDMIARGFVVIAEDKKARTITLRKIR
jgi:hypothetical protein